MKFLHELKEHWESRGHEVRYEMGASDKLAQWADLYFVDTWSNNIHWLYDLYHGDPRKARPDNWDNNKKPKFVCRAIDYEVWLGLARDQAIIDWVDQSICIAPHIERRLRADNRWDRLACIPCAINLEKYSLITREKGYNVLIPCNEIDWVLKNVAEGMKIFALIRRVYADFGWRLFIRGKWCQGEYFKKYHEDLLDKLDIRGVTTIIDQPVADYNLFLEDMDYCLVPSYKEAFSFVTGECAAKGIKPILNWWYGAEEIWPREWMYLLPTEAVEMFGKDFQRKDYRKFIEEHKNVKTMLHIYDELLET